MRTEPRTRLPLAGLLIVFVAPLASLMVIVPSLFAAQASPATAAHAPNALGSALANLPTMRHGITIGGATHGQVPLPSPEAAPHPAGPSAPTGLGPATPPLVTAPVATASVAGAPQTAIPAVNSSSRSDRGKHRGRRHHTADDDAE